MTTTSNVNDPQPSRYPTKPGHNRYDLIVVGGGIVGLATARELLHRQPGLKLLVLEKEPELARHQSGHNSGVIHTGIYYAPGSFKARACVAGHASMLDFCQQHSIKYDLCGKVIVALDESELPRLHDLYQRGITNGVQGLELIEPERLRELEPYAAGIKAIFSPNTGIIDYVQVALAMARDIVAAGGEIATDCKVLTLDEQSDGTRLQVKSACYGEVEFFASVVVTCAGLYSDRLSGQSKTVQIVPFRGDYYTFKPDKTDMVRSLIYPVPDPQFPFLGVHFTRRIDGEVWAGPNAVLAFARQGYGRWNIKPGELGQTLTFPGFWKLAGRYWRTGLAEMYRDYRKAAFVKALQRYMPELKADDLIPGPSGVRAQALDRSGKLVDDFLILQRGKVVHVQNAPSPAATTSLIIGQNIADEVAPHLPITPTPK